jgi:hypothetical protein
MCPLPANSSKPQNCQHCWVDAGMNNARTCRCVLQLPSMDNQPTQLAWAHPQHGQLLAVGTRNGCVHVIQGHGPTSSHSSSHAGQQKQARATELQRQGAGSWACTERLQCGKGPVRWVGWQSAQSSSYLPRRITPGTEPLCWTLAALTQLLLQRRRWLSVDIHSFVLAQVYTSF